MPLIPKKRISDHLVNLNQGICARNGISDAKPFQSPFLNKTPTKRPSRNAAEKETEQVNRLFAPIDCSAKI